MQSKNAGIYWSRLDHLRFFAAMLVIFKHVWDMAGGPQGPHTTKFLTAIIQSGHIGVSLFLVLTGFLFVQILDRYKQGIIYHKFIYNRLLRIFPLLTVVFFTFLAVGKEYYTDHPLPILNLLFLQLNFGDELSGFGQSVFPVGAWWTVAVEFQFYLVFPLIYGIFMRKGPGYLIGLLATFIMINLGIFLFKGDCYWLMYHSIIGRMSQFLIGMLAACIALKKTEVVKKYALLLFALSLSLMFSLSYYYQDNEFFKNILTFPSEAIVFSMMILGYQYLNVTLPQIADKLFSRLGEMSFSIYLLHALILEILIKNIGFLSITGHFAIDVIIYSLTILLPVVLVVSSMTYSFIEKPFMEMRVKYAR
ncbi:acyltransferase family protein [Pantoea ananatis]|uniref:acyltransferase family protein n=1 Tax=Pantoea ananas TaxID=553 RepID=UPI001B305D5D|nr:acyltransferase [Pantoea ananatis]